jgi:RNA polymerase sigma-70 factor, ECF subfamily
MFATVDNGTNNICCFPTLPEANHILALRKNHSDPDLVAALQSGDHSVLSEVYDRYGTAVYRLGMKMLGNATEAEDLTQEVFLTFWQGIAKYDSQRGTILTYLLTIARSRSLNKIRQGKSRQNLLNQCNTNFATEYLPPDQIQMETVADRVGLALTEIPLAQKQVLELAYYGDLSQSTIATQLNLPLGTVKTRSRQGLLKLRQLLQDLV